MGIIIMDDVLLLDTFFLSAGWWCLRVPIFLLHRRLRSWSWQKRWLLHHVLFVLMKSHKPTKPWAKSQVRTGTGQVEGRLHV